MNVKFMRWVDLHVGRVIANLMSIFSKRSDVIPDTGIKKIVVAKFFGLGSITLSTPLLQAIRDRFPDARIYFLSFKPNTELLKLYPFIDEVVTVEYSSVFTFIFDTIRKIIFFLGLKIDLFIDMEFFSHYSALFALLSGSKHRVGFHTSLLPKGKLLNHRVRFNPHRYVMEAFIELGRKIGAKSRYPLYKPDLKGRLGRLDDRLNGHGIIGHGYVVVNAKASEHLGRLKMWVAKKWTELIERIVNECALKVVLTGVKDDREEIDEISAPLPGDIKESVYNSAGEFSFSEFLQLLSGAKVLITVDSGPLHLAQSMGIPCVSLFGPETPTLYGPRGDLNETVYLGLYCSPCYNVLEGKKVDCTNPVYRKCMDYIEVDTVWENFLNLLKVIEEKDEE